MTLAHRTQLAFHLGATPAGPELDPIRGLDLLPALFARYRDLSALRYDFPVVLVQGHDDGAFVRPLSDVVDDVLADVATGEDAARVAGHVLELEAQIRALAAQGTRGPLSVLWDRAAAAYAAHSEIRQDSINRARAVLAVDGEVADCDEALPARLLQHAWERIQTERGRRFRAHAGRLVQELGEILRASFAHSEAGRAAGHLKASVGSTYAEAFDFAAMARMLATSSPAATIDDARRRRIHTLTAALSAQLFYPAEGDSGFSFAFESCTAAIRAFRERLPRLVDLARTLAIAELEVRGEYNDARHGAFFEQLAAGGVAIDPHDLALFPDYFVRIKAAAMDPLEHDALLEILSSGLPIKVLVESDDVFADPPGADGQRGAAARSRQLGRIAVGLASAYVVQSPSSHLVQLRSHVLQAMTSNGPALFSICTGASPEAGALPPYLAAAAALESRAFPAFVYDPAGGRDGAPRLDLSINPQPDADWPVYRLDHEDAGHASAFEDVAFTTADLAACDRRYARHFARVPRAAWGDDMVPLDGWLALDPIGRRGKVPYLLLVDRDNRLQRVIADDTVVRETRLCLDRWRSLRQLAGAHRPAESAPTAAAGAAAGDVVEPPVQAATAPAPTTRAEPAPAVAADRPVGDPYIETPRCSTCNECTLINNRMFAYDGNRQAYIADADAGTFRQLVEAAESCQVSIIHPGKPRNPNEPGLDELLERAALFQ